jgi:predicted site-specific integrase-resolvase
VQEPDYGRILVTYEDRLTRFGFSYLERYFDCYGVTISVIEDETDKSAQQELVDELIAPAVALSESNADGSDERGPVVQQCTRFLRCNTESY